MGFLKFLKREAKKDSLDELDLPPAPPPLDDAGKDFGAGFGGEMPELPDFPELDEKISAPDKMPKFDFPEEEKMPDMGKYISDFPSFPEMEEEMPAPPNPATAPVTEPAAQPVSPISQQEPEPVYKEIEPFQSYPKSAGKLFSHETKSLRQHPDAKAIYVRIDNFKATLGNINILRNDLRKSEEVLNKLETIKNSKDKSFDKVRASLDDLQKKLIFIDKTLFKSDETDSFPKH